MSSPLLANDIVLQWSPLMDNPLLMLVPLGAGLFAGLVSMAVMVGASMRRRTHVNEEVAAQRSAHAWSLRARASKLFRRRGPQYVVVWWPNAGQLPLPDMPELIGPFRRAERALTVRDSIRSQQRRQEKMAHVTVIAPVP